jgi:hypothetical protein
MAIVDLDGVNNAAASAAGGLTKGVTLGGFNPGDTLTLSLPSGQTHVAWSAWSSGARWLNEFRVIRDGDPNNVAVFGDLTQHATAEAARAAFAGGSITGASSYTFYIQDAGASISDNRGGLSVETVLTPATIAQGVARTIRAVFFRLATTPDPLRLWCGINDIPIGIDVIDEAGAVYLGAGRLLNVPDLEVLINGKADRVDFLLPGVTVENAARVAAAAPDVKGKALHIGVATLDDRYQPLTAITPVWYGLADLWRMRQPKTADLQAPTRTLVLSVGSGATGRARARRASYTSAQQKLVHPTDKFCDFTSRYTTLRETKWPNF